MTTYTPQQIIEIATLPESAFRLQATISQLTKFYVWIKETWTKQAIQSLAKQHELNLRSHENQAKFAWYAAQLLASELPALPGSNSDVTASCSESKELQSEPMTSDCIESQIVRVLATALALLPPVPETNGLEFAPAYQIMGNPIYVDELDRNYIELARRWHPDRNSHHEAIIRFQMIADIYKNLRSHWHEKYSPLIPLSRLGTENLQSAMSAVFDFDPASFWQ